LSLDRKLKPVYSSTDEDQVGRLASHDKILVVPVEAVKLDMRPLCRQASQMVKGFHPRNVSPPSTTSDHL
jgi:hypothetical protein